MTPVQRSDPADGLCWYCRRQRGGAQSLALPFWSRHGDAVQVLVLPRCDECAAFHHRQQFPSGLLIVAGAAAAAIPASLLPLDESVRGFVIVPALLAGFVIGYLVAANRDDWQARRRGTRPLWDYVQHPPYHALAADTAQWRQNYRPGIPGGSSSRCDTVAELARYFTGIAHEPEVIATLARGCAEAGVAWPAESPQALPIA